jgi:hypothetical protein
MKVFVSSLISGFGPERQAARRAITTLRYEPVMAEDLGAQPNSPQVACLQALRGSDVVVLILGVRYGAVPPGSTLSATHQEYREARGVKPVLAFVQQGVSPEPEQQAFIDEVQGWEGGLFRGGFDGPEELQVGITQALHDLALANAVGPLDEGELLRRAAAMLPPENRNQVSSAFIDLALASGPTQRILRPVELEEARLADEILQSAMFGAHRFFDRGQGSEPTLAGSDLVIRQERGASLLLNEQGALLLRMPLDEPRQRGGFGMDAMNGMVILEEVVQQRLATALGFAADLLERIDSTQRLTHVAIAARLLGAEYRAWRTRSQHAASPNSIQMAPFGGGERQPVSQLVRRSALRLDRTGLVEDLLVPLRRQFASG